jgi:hypothetical protein
MPLFKRAEPVPEPVLEPVEEAPSGPYSGRLAFDSESGFHLAEDGHPVVTHDSGKTWVYAEDGDKSHITRYQQQIKTIDSTANKHAELAIEHGEARANELVEPHHFAVQSQDPHFGQIMLDPDLEAPLKTGHTDAWRDE